MKNQKSAKPAKKPAPRPQVGRAKQAIELSPLETAQLMLTRAEGNAQKSAARLAEIEGQVAVRIDAIVSESGIRPQIAHLEDGRMRERLMHRRHALILDLAQVDVDLLKLGQGKVAPIRGVEKPAQPAPAKPAEAATEPPAESPTPKSDEPPESASADQGA